MQSNGLTKLATILFLSLTVAGCTTTMGSSGPTKLTCTSFPPISWSGKDTPETVKQVKAHNAARKAVCR